MDNVSPSTPEDDDDDDAASVNPPQPETDPWVPSDGSSPWMTDRTATRSNTLADSVYKTFTSPSLLRVLTHTTQPMFTGTVWSERTPQCERMKIRRVSVAGGQLDARLCPLMDLCCWSNHLCSH